ncbi:type II toxin-antitoxin system VapC family toxin [Haloechinothrix sp. LS1_15]|uniref:type II toxin-antitoxin system VapC family toxin n=1 Tax=Haloechinothrix sp. LS1_15 TaxID=2652248 RepID=UPI0029450D7B|nr:type II toxin-antitoxin system VapC family toxin [Haloechinothrix sp. LS1_15]MDV6011914.1 type II toxin-antitoxin system VapC family toxin [Haloechinothrix sp. LS1_15]
MIVLDTNVISELMRREPEPAVLTWLDHHPADDVFITAVTEAEVRFGLARLPEGHRKELLTARFDELVAEDFEGQVLVFDSRAATLYADIVVRRDQLGRPINMADAQIAAICRVHNARLVTRNTKAVTDTGVDVIDPWQR